MSIRIHVAFAVVASAVVGFAVVWGFVLAGSPSTRRVQLMDERRLQDLQAIVRAIEAESVETSITQKIDSARHLKHPLPKDLEEAAKNDRYEKLSIHDPETRQPYDYKVVNPTTFQLCATFSQPRNAEYRVFWNHPAGRQCFTINVLEPPP
jgi:hypothetical protein